MKNFFFSIIAISLFLITLFISLNVLLGGVPLFNIFNLNISDAIFISKKQENKKLYKVLFNKEHTIHKCGKSENGFYNMAYKKDIFGFRENDNQLFYDTDIILIGDSFGLSSCINSPHDLNTKLRKKLSNKKILNISRGGTGPYYQKELLINLIKKNNTKFDTLIWFFYEGNDHGDLKKNYNKRFSFNFKPIKNWDNRNIDKTKVNYYPSTNIHILKFKLFLANFFRGFGSLAKYLKTYPDLLPNEKYYDEVTNELASFLNENNVQNKFIFYIPGYTRLAYKQINHPHIKQFDNLKSLVKKIANKQNFIFIDGVSIYHNRKNPLDVFHYSLPTHFNIEGYEILAEHLSSIIKSLD